MPCSRVWGKLNALRLSYILLRSYRMELPKHQVSQLLLCQQLGQNLTSWELRPPNADSCVMEIRAATVSGKTLLQGEEAGMQARRKPEVLLSPSTIRKQRQQLEGSRASNLSKPTRREGRCHFTIIFQIYQYLTISFHESSSVWTAGLQYLMYVYCGIRVVLPNRV